METWRGGRRKSKQPARHQSTVSAPQSSSPCADNPAAELVNLKVPTVRVSLVQSVQLLPHQSQAVEVALTGTLDTNAAEVDAEADGSTCSAYVCELRDELLRGRERCCAATSLKIDYAVTHLNIDSIMCACVEV